MRRDLSDPQYSLADQKDRLRIMQNVQQAGNGDSGHPGTGADSLTLGTGTYASGDRSSVYGAYAEAEGADATAIGSGAFANHDRSTAIGYNAGTGADDEVKLGDTSARVQIVGRLNVVTRTPSSSSDTQGITNDICWDENYIYVKTPAGWKRSGLSAF